MKVIHFNLKKWHSRLVFHTSNLLLDENPELNKFLKENKEEIILSDDDFRASSNIMVQKLFDLIINFEELIEDIENLYPRYKPKKVDEDDDLPF